MTNIQGDDQFIKALCKLCLKDIWQMTRIETGWDPYDHRKVLHTSSHPEIRSIPSNPVCLSHHGATSVLDPYLFRKLIEVCWCWQRGQSQWRRYITHTVAMGWPCTKHIVAYVASLGVWYWKLISNTSSVSKYDLCWWKWRQDFSF